MKSLVLEIFQSDDHGREGKKYNGPLGFCARPEKGGV